MCYGTHHNPFVLGLVEFNEEHKRIVYIVDEKIAFF